ncbi:hypothetical protein ACWPM1_04325 [Tsuneonella sp. HG249]
MLRALVAGVLAMLSGACATTNSSADSLDAIADDYVLLQLTIGEKEAGYIDAFYGDEAIMQRAKQEAGAATLANLSQRATALEARTARFFAEDGRATTTMDERRARFLTAQLVAAHTRLRMLQGETLPFADEAEGLFGVRPSLPALASFEPVIARIEKLVPGEGALWQRIDALQRKFDIPADRLKAVMDAGIAECRRRSAAYIGLPAEESFELALVTDKPWSGYNYYQGNYRSKIEINTDLPVRLERAIDLGCHEGYPGHHVYNTLLERELVNRRGWREFTVYPLYSPQSLIAEGSANYGIDLAFPEGEQLAFASEVLAPLAGLPTADLPRYLAVNEALSELSAVRYTVAAKLLSGEIDDARAQSLLQQYQLQSPERAAQSVKFIRAYRSYVINYGLGQDMVRAYVEAAGPDQDARWKRMEALLSEPTLPGDLLAR